MEQPHWRPQTGPQHALIKCPIYEILYGGARGGGKTDGVLGKMAALARRYGRHFNALVFRRELPGLDDMIERAHDIFGPTGARWGDQKKQWRFPGGGRLRFRPLERVEDAGKYQGQNISHAAVEEVGEYPDPRPIQRLHGVLRSAHGVPVQLMLTGNPGGPGQHWLKARFVDPYPSGMKVHRGEVAPGLVKERVYIPAKVWDNRIMLASDPDSYIASLHMVGSAALVKAWLDGDWSAVEGQFFDCWDQSKHVIEPFTIPRYWTRFRSFDWGSASPFSVGWWAVSGGDLLDDGRAYPKGALVRYREWYGDIEEQVGVGLKMRNEDIAAGILAREAKDEEIEYSVGDPSIWSNQGGISIGEQFAAAGVIWQPGDNRIAPKRGPMSGWAQLRGRLIGQDDNPMMYFFSTCPDAIRTLPALQHDEIAPERPDEKGEDHAPDEIRYACMTRPWVAPKPAAPPDITEPDSIHSLVLAQERADKRRGGRRKHI